jgi:hypothetical protein
VYAIDGLFVCSAAETISSGFIIFPLDLSLDKISAKILSEFWDIRQFWQKGQRKLQPAKPSESIFEPGLK